LQISQFARFAQIYAVRVSEFVRKAWRANRSGNRGKVVEQLICNFKEGFLRSFSGLCAACFTELTRGNPVSAPLRRIAAFCSKIQRTVERTVKFNSIARVGMVQG